MSNHPFRPLRHRAVRLLWSAALVSDIGTWVQLIVVGTLVAHDTGSAVKTGLVALATFMPQGIASPIGGLLADKFDRRRVFASALLLQATMTTVLAIVLGSGVRTPAVLTAIILVASGAGALGAPSYQAMLPDLVAPDELVAMISLGVYSWNGGRIIGPMLGTLLAATVGPAWTIGFNAASFVVLSGAVWAVRRPFRPPQVSAGTVVERLVGGWRALRVAPGSFHGVVIAIVVNLMLVPFMGLIPIYATREFGGSTGLTGAISSAQGIGAIVGGLIVTMLAAHMRRSRLLGLLVTWLAVALLAYAHAPNTVTVVACAAVLGAGISAFFVTTSALIQRDAPPASRGRIMSLNQASMGVSYGIGLLTIGSIGDVFDLHVAFTVGAAGMVLAFLLARSRSNTWYRALDGEPLDPAPQLVPA
ncbi:MAG: MFS transporter [Acidimicrobiales bacterium]